MLPLQNFKNGDDTELLTMKILMVDDEPFNIVLMEKILQRAGFTQIFTTVDSRQALALCLQHKPDLILLDLRMPHMDGFEVMHQLQNSEQLRLIPIIVLTSENIPQTRMQALSEGAKDFISKPFDRNETLKRIQNTLETRLLHNHLLEQNHNLDQIVQERTRELQYEQQRLRDLNDRLEELVRKRTEDLQLANEELAQANNTMSQLVSVVSHELRTPLTAIKSFVEILRDEADNLDHEQQKNFLNIIDKESNRLNRLISDLLDLQKIHAGKMKWKSEILDIVKIARETQDIFLPAMSSKNLEFISRTDIESAKIFCDSDKIIQVLSNLLSNAIKFTDNGTISVQISRRTHWAKALLLSNDPDTSDALEKLFNDMQVTLTQVNTVNEAISQLNCNGGNINLAIIDLSASDNETVNQLERIRKGFPSLPLATIINANNEDKYQSPEWEGTIKKPIIPGVHTEYVEPLVTNIIGMMPNTTMIDVAVTDSGIGIPEQELHNVFSQFYQIDNSQKREHRGTGLGLAICKEIVEHYGGKIWAHSQPGEGSTFHVMLPEIKENKKKLGEILVEKGIVTEKQLTEALKQQN
jgi:signal transduction histidine kinase